MNSIINKRKPYFDKEGNLHIPNDIKFGGEVVPKLKVTEWFYLLLLIADKTNLSSKKEKELFKNIVGSRTTKWRIKKSLKEKGYL